MSVQAALDDAFEDACASLPASNLKGNAPMIFTGTTDIMKLPNFIITMKVQFVTRHIYLGSEKIAFFGRNLAGPAAEWFYEWFENHGDDDLNFDNFIEDFRGNFIQKLDPQKIMNAMTALKQTSKGVEHYNIKFRQLWSLMPPDYWTEKGALLSYMRGLNPATASLVALANPTCLEDAYRAAYSTVAITNRFLEDLSKPAVDHEGDVIMTGAAVKGYERSERSNKANYSNYHNYSNSSNNYSRDNRGSNKGKLSRSECIKKHLCFKCQRPGHNFRNCQGRGADASNRY